jgi:hypothetical protein
MKNPVMSYEERERLKEEGREEYADTSKSLPDRKIGLLKVIFAHYERSREMWKELTERGEEKSPHGTWGEYVQSWLVANGERLAPPEILASLQLDFPVPSVIRIGPGRSYWNTQDDLTYAE